MLCVQAQGKAKEEEREDGEITDSEKQVKAEEKRQKAREDMEAAQRELKVCLLQPAPTAAGTHGLGGLTEYRLCNRDMSEDNPSLLLCRRAGERLATSSS